MAGADRRLFHRPYRPASYGCNCRGLASGLTSAGFGVSAITVVPIANMIQSNGYETAFLYFGIAQGLVIMIVAPYLRFPKAHDAIGADASTVLADLIPIQTLSQPTFWLLYIIFTLVLTGGLMSTAQLAPIAQDLKISNVPLSILGLTLPALTFALTLDRTLNGITRPLFGWVSDRLGRENTMFFVFLMDAGAILLLACVGRDPTLFVIASALVFLAWGEIFTLFPALCTDLFGGKFATTNYGMLYTAKGVAAILIPLGSLLAGYTGTWSAVFFAAALFNIVAGVLTFFVLKPARIPMRDDQVLPKRSKLQGAAPSYPD
jgi:MFS transporter, OFA family, oxalate/formate antiporter